MILLALIAGLAAIAALCGLLFTLAIYALPACVGIMIGTCAGNAGAGVAGAIVIGLIAAVATLAIGHVLLAVARPTWLKLAIAALFVAPAVLAGFHATHGIVKHLMPSETFQILFSVIGAIAVGCTAFVRVAGLTATAGPPAQSLVRA